MILWDVSIQMDAMDADDPTSLDHPPRSAVDFLHHSHPRFNQSSLDRTSSSSSTLPPHAPHHAPPLHLNLAGSPHATGMSRSSSSSSDSSLSLSPHHSRTGLHQPQQHQHQQPQQSSPMPQEVPMPPSPQRRQGGWKVTFGYRSDCQKCLDRVPGHYSHVVHDGGSANNIASGR